MNGQDRVASEDEHPASAETAESELQQWRQAVSDLTAIANNRYAALCAITEAIGLPIGREDSHDSSWHEGLIESARGHLPRRGEHGHVRFDAGSAELGDWGEESCIHVQCGHRHGPGGTRTLALSPQSARDIALGIIAALARYQLWQQAGSPCEAEIEAEIDYEQLDPGIRQTVRWLRSHGFDTRDSGDGVTKVGKDAGAVPWANVAITVSPMRLLAEADRLARLVRGLGCHVSMTGHAKPDEVEALTGAYRAEDWDHVTIQAIYSPDDEEEPSAVICLTGLSDKHLAK